MKCDVSGDVLPRHAQTDRTVRFPRFGKPCNSHKRKLRGIRRMTLSRTHLGRKAASDIPLVGTWRPSRNGHGRHGLEPYFRSCGKRNRNARREHRHDYRNTPLLASGAKARRVVLIAVRTRGFRNILACVVWKIENEVFLVFPNSGIENHGRRLYEIARASVIRTSRVRV